jgi:hypothetical protein
VFFLAGVLGSMLLPVSGCATERLPESSEVTRRMIARAQAVARDEQGPQYSYEKRTLLKQLDAEGQIIKSEERLYQVRLMAGFPFTRLVRIQGRELNREELEKEQLREEKFQQKFTSVDARRMAARKEAWVTAQLLERYKFVVKERVILDSRPTLVVAFKPKPGILPAKTVHDKLLNRMGGTVWVDEEDADAARLRVNLLEAISLGWFGVLGSLSRCELALERQRMPEGVWVNAKQTLLVHCRKLAVPLRFCSTEESSGFLRVNVK